MLSVIKTELLPGSMGFLLLGMIVGVVLLYRGGGAWGRRWLVCLVAVYLTLSTPVVARWMQRGLAGPYAPAESIEDVDGATAIVLLGSGSVSYRAREIIFDEPTPQSMLSAIEAARVYQLLPRPLLIASGGRPDPGRQLRPEADILRDRLIDLGVPREQILVETESLDTHDQAVFIGPLLKKHGIARFILVASTIHMCRAKALFEREGLRPVPSVSQTEFEAAPPSFGWPWLPAPRALRGSQAASYAFLAIGYGVLRGWLAPQDAWRCGAA